MNHLSPLQDKSIDGALLALRKHMIRGKLDGLAHVDALLMLRGVHMPAVLPAKKPDVAKCGQMTRLVREALRGGPLKHVELTAIVAGARPELSPYEFKKRTSQALYNMKFAGGFGQGWAAVGAGPVTRCQQPRFCFADWQKYISIWARSKGAPRGEPTTAYATIFHKRYYLVFDSFRIGPSVSTISD